MIPRFIAAAFLLTTVGCATTRVERHTLPFTLDRPGEKAAMAIVWVGTYERSEPPPQVLYVEDADLNCTSPHGKRGIQLGAECVGGYTNSAQQIVLGWVSGMKFSTSGFAHELTHAAELLDGIWDPDHTGGFHAHVADANARLAAAGL